MAAAVGRALVHLPYIVAVTVLGFVLITLAWPFVAFLIDSGFRNSILAFGGRAVVSIFPMGWGTLFQHLDPLTILVGSFVLGEVGTVVTAGLFYWPSTISRSVGFISRKILGRPLPKIWTPMEGTREEAEFRLWLV